jgi:molecular chaperone GrpE
MKMASSRRGFGTMDEEKEQPEEQGKSDEQVKTLEDALETEKKRSEDYMTQLKYARADLENLKKRFDRQLEDAEKYSNERIITQLLDVAEELEMAVKSARTFNSTENLVQGVEMTLKKLNRILENEGVTPIKSVGEPFNPEKHHAVERTEKQGVETCTITEEVRKGYMMRDKVIRPSIVKIEVPQSQSQKETKSNEQ